MKSLVSVLLFAFVNLGGIFFFNKKNKAVDDESEQDYSHLLCRFVVDGLGRKLGESISLDEDILIIKSGTKFLGVPLKHIEEREKTLLVKGLVDLDKAYEMGENWRKESFCEINKKEGSEGKKDGF